MTFETLAILTGTAPDIDLSSHAREDDAVSNADALLNSTNAALAYVETAIGQTLYTRRRRATLTEFPDDANAIDLTETASEIESITYVDTNGDTQTVDSGDYALIELPGSGVINASANWPTDETTVYITYKSPAPHTAIQAVRMLAAYWYEQREGASDRPVSEVPHAVDALILQTRGVLVG